VLPKDGTMINPTAVAARIEALLRSRYRQIPRDDNEKILDAVLKFWLQILEGNISRKSMLKEVAGVIHRSLMFQEIAIAVRDEKDNLYRYQVIVGFTKDAVDVMQTQVFSEAEVRAFDRLPGIRVSRLIEFTISEAPQKIGEEAQFNRPMLAAMPRKADDEFTFGDYMNIYIPGRDDELLGYIEVSGPRDGKLPTGSRMKGLELLAVMTGAALECQADDRKPAEVQKLPELEMI
jgi:hypothetical protein